jgi:cytochrome c oxidase subunit 1
MADSTVSVPERMDETLQTASGRRGTYLELLHSWIVTVDHKRIGILYTFASSLRQRCFGGT